MKKYYEYHKLDRNCLLNLSNEMQEGENKYKKK